MGRTVAKVESPRVVSAWQQRSPLGSLRPWMTSLAWHSFLLALSVLLNWAMMWLISTFSARLYSTVLRTVTRVVTAMWTSFQCLAGYTRTEMSASGSMASHEPELTLRRLC